jgi:hypothetical protein
MRGRRFIAIAALSARDSFVVKDCVVAEYRHDGGEISAGPTMA